MKSVFPTIVHIIYCFIFSSTVVYGFPDTCIPGTCNGDLHNSQGQKRGTYSNWAFRADATSSGEWSYDVPGTGTSQSTDATGTYTYNPGVSALATYTGTANFPAHPEYGTSTYSMQLSLTFSVEGYCQGDWSIDFDNPAWDDLAGTWHHATRYYSLINDYVDGIYIYRGLSYGEPDQTEILYQFDAQIDTYDTVDLIEVTTPGTPGVADGFTFQIPQLEDQWDDVNQVWTSYEYDPDYDVYYWMYSKSSYDSCDLDKYGDGWYQITAFYTGGSESTEIWFGTPVENKQLDQPIQEPNITNYTNRQRLESPVTFEWELCTDPNADSIWFGTEYVLTYDDWGESLPVTATSYGPVDFNDGYWMVNISFDHGYMVERNADGLYYELGKYSESVHYFGFGVLAELTGDNTVNFEDFSKVAQRWLDDECDDWNSYCDRADLNFDYHVNYDDVKIISEDWLAQASGP